MQIRLKGTKGCTIVDYTQIKIICKGVPTEAVWSKISEYCHKLYDDVDRMENARPSKLEC